VSTLGQGVRQSLRLSFLTADQTFQSRGNHLIEPIHTSQTVSPMNAGGSSLIMRDGEETMLMHPSSLPMVSERHANQSIVLPLSKQEIKLPLLNPGVTSKKNSSYQL
jgi:hypothetical protein